MFGSWKKLNHYLFMKATYWFVCNDHISKLQTLNVILVDFLDISFKGHGTFKFKSNNAYLN